MRNKKPAHSVEIKLDLYFFENFCSEVMSKCLTSVSPISDTRVKKAR